MDFELKAIGWVHSGYTSLEQCPYQGQQQDPVVEIRLEEDYAPGLERLISGQEIEVLTWLHQGDRSVLTCHPQNDHQRPLHGVFMTRSPNRPNPIGLHRVRVLQRQGAVLKVHPLEVIHGTPVLDIKPVHNKGATLSWGENISASDAQMIQDVASKAWTKDLLNGLNGNLSIRVGGHMIVTCSGCATGHLRPGDLICVDLTTGKPCGAGGMSSEAKMHQEIYAHQPQAQAILHSHPPYLIALSMSHRDNFLRLPLFESDIFKKMMVSVPALTPGTKELAQAVGQVSEQAQAIFLERHGLVCWSETLIGALGLSEELEGLARIQWLHHSL
jgi:L-fuculose-phosphate aldolase